MDPRYQTVPADCSKPLAAVQVLQQRDEKEGRVRMGRRWRSTRHLRVVFANGSGSTFNREDHSALRLDEKVISFQNGVLKKEERENLQRGINDFSRDMDKYAREDLQSIIYRTIIIMKF